MTRGALWKKHRGIALGIASEFRVPGLDADDVRQEALVALWEATGAYDAARGPFPALARTVIRRHLTDMLRAATTLGRTADFDRETEPLDPRDRIAARLKLVELMRQHAGLSDAERAAVAGHLNGLAAKSSRSHDNALVRARRKLAA